MLILDKMENNITTKRIPKNTQKRLESFIKANKKYLAKGNNMELHRERCRLNAKTYYHLKTEIKRLSSITIE